MKSTSIKILQTLFVFNIPTRSINIAPGWHVSSLLRSGSAFVIALGLGISAAFTQGIGTTYVNNTTNSISSPTNVVEESCFFGPNSVITLTSDLVIYSKYVWIAPTATFTGSGKIIFRNPSVVGGAASATLIDGNNGAFIEVNIDHDNGANMVLTNFEDGSVPANAVVTANLASRFDPLPDPATTATGDLKIGAQFNMVSITQPSPFDGGELTLNGNNFVFDADATIHGYRDNRFVNTGNSITGHMVKTFGAAPNNMFVFPVGFKPASYEYNPARITATSGTFYVSVQTFDQSVSDESVIEAEENVQRTWHIYADVATEANVETQHQSGQEDNGWDASLPYIVSRWLGGTAWELNDEAFGTPGDLSDATVGPNNNNVQTAFEPTQKRNLTYLVPGSPTSTLSYSTHTYRSNTALPVTLISFNAMSEGASTNLTWKTSSEVNSASFAVQRSGDAKVWDTIGEVTASGESSTEKHYFFTDKNPLSAANYYRLKMIDRDATFAYSTIRNITFTESVTQTYTYPNPTSGVINLNDNDLSKISLVEIVDLSGKSIYQTRSMPKQGINVQDFKNGRYILKISYKAGAVISHKVLIAR